MPYKVSAALEFLYLRLLYPGSYSSVLKLFIKPLLDFFTFTTRVCTRQLATQLGVVDY